MNRHLTFSVLALLVTTVGGCRNTFEAVAEVVMTPSKPFAETPPPPAPDYSADSAWLARPDLKDDSDIDVDEATLRTPRPADVFFLYPTVYISGSGWNQPIDEALTNMRENMMGNPIAAQASVFNACCNIYAPAYRQASIVTYLGVEDGPKALDLAYDDVKRAFTYYLEHHNEGRPLILAGHSQGAAHVFRLLEELFSQTPLKDRLVAAYVVGTPLPLEKLAALPDIPACDDSDDTGCVVSWNTQAPGAAIPNWQRDYWLRLGGNYVQLGHRPILCVNPLSFERDGGHVEAAKNLGLVVESGGKLSVTPGYADAACRNGRLEAKANGAMKDFGTGEGNYHVYDYNLFYMNVRENAARRVDAFAKHGRPAATIATPKASPAPP